MLVTLHGRTPNLLRSLSDGFHRHFVGTEALIDTAKLCIDRLSDGKARPRLVERLRVYGVSCRMARVIDDPIRTAGLACLTMREIFHGCLHDGRNGVVIDNDTANLVCHAILARCERVDGAPDGPVTVLLDPEEFGGPVLWKFEWRWRTRARVSCERPT